jgi:hypothetical protein
MTLRKYQIDKVYSVLMAGEAEFLQDVLDELCRNVEIKETETSKNKCKKQELLPCLIK